MEDGENTAFWRMHVHWSEIRSRRRGRGGGGVVLNAETCSAGRLQLERRDGFKGFFIGKEIKQIGGFLN